MWTSILLLAAVASVFSTPLLVSAALVRVPAAQAVHVEGRWAPGSRAGALAFDWPAVAVSFEVDTSAGVQEVSLHVAGYGAAVEVYQYIDGRAEHARVVYLGSGAESELVLARDVPPGPRLRFVVAKRTEALLSPQPMEVFAVVLAGGAGVSAAAVAPWSVPRRYRVAWLGDSQTAGFGDLGTMPCNNSAHTENALAAFAPVSSERLNASYHVLAVSGIGVARNYGVKAETSPHNFPSVFESALSSANASWDFRAWVPDAAVINLGTNDCWDGVGPSQDVFETHFRWIVDTARARWGEQLPLLFMVGPMMSEKEPCVGYVRSLQQTYPRSALLDVTGILTPHELGCDYHPNVLGHLKLAAQVEPAVLKLLQLP